MSFTKGVSRPNEGRTQKLTPEEIRDVEDTQDKYEESLTDFAKATLWQLMKARGMDTDKAREIRVKAGATK